MQQVLPSSLFSSKELMSSLSTPPCLQMPAQPVQAPRCSVSLPHLCSPNHTFLAGSHLPEQGCLDSAKLNYLDEYFIAFFLINADSEQSRLVLNLDQIKQFPLEERKSLEKFHSGIKKGNNSYGYFCPVGEVELGAPCRWQGKAQLQECRCSYPSPVRSQPLATGVCVPFPAARVLVPTPSCSSRFHGQGLHRSCLRCSLKHRVRRKPCLLRNVGRNRQGAGCWEILPSSGHRTGRCCPVCLPVSVPK